MTAPPRRPGWSLDEPYELRMAAEDLTQMAQRIHVLNQRPSRQSSLAVMRLVARMQQVIARVVSEQGAVSEVAR